ncbi:MAG: hypothetical protein K6T90_06230 [Leptolyngbyaceae cyanobacterium HOT.MB2.61]|nr:hypothetical protein [Leptolyngbyaceae cyanobacterium HOT.MB2.61]
MPRQWTQFFSQVESPDFHAALEARIHDPLWLLTRQWQMGEFHGEDAGSPVRVEVEHYAHKIDLIRIADNTIYHPYRPEDGPLEARVEQESRTQVKPDLRTRAQVGMMFLQQLEQTGLPFNKGTLLTRFGFNPTEFDGETDGAVQLLLKRALDSERLYESFESLTDAKITEFFGVTEPEMVTSYRQFINSWKNTYAAQIGKTLGQDAWLEDRMEYRFAVSVPTSFGRVELVAEEYPGGRLDWDSFTIQSVNTSDIMHKPILKKETLLPSPVTFAGMPFPRFWEFEDGAVDFGNPDAVDRDLGRLLLAEFVMAWGNDWFQVPIEVPAGALCKINQLHVTDTFGIKTSILP